MPSWLWRDWLGPAGRAPRGLLGRRPRRRRLLPPPPEGLPGPCPDGPAFIVLSNLLGRVLTRCRAAKISRCTVPHGLRQALTAWAHSHSSCGPLHLLSHNTWSQLSTIHF